MTEQMMVMDTGRGSAERYSCPSCSKSFVRKAHMLRHQQQHDSQKPFFCNFCSKSFKRSDVLRAHQFRCKERGNLPVPEGQSKGRKRSSCASCVKLRTRCDQETPCGRCQELGKDCVRENGSHPRPLEIARPRSRDAIPIHHLLNTPPGDDLPGRFPIRDVALGSVDEDEDAVLNDAEDSSEASHWSEDRDPYDPYVGADMTFESFFGGLENLTFAQYPTQADALTHVSDMGAANQNIIYQPLEPRALEVKTALHSTALNFANLPETQHMVELAPQINFFTGAEIALLVGLYFQKYHRHCPILHRPSFQPTMCPLPLLLSTMALGGMYSPDPARVQRIRSLLDVMEAYVFSLPGLRDEYNGSLNLADAPNDDILQIQFEVFQGAYLLVIAQYFSGNLAAKRRARRQRFTRVLDIARSFKILTSQHGPFVTIPDEGAFKTWIRQETRIRQMNIMLAFDAAMAIFNNVPPRISFSELDLQLPCNPQYFELASYQEMVLRSTFPKPKMKLLDAFQKLFTPSSSLSSSSGFSSELREFANAVVDKDALNCWDMLLLIHCLYTHAWRQTFGNPLLRTSPSTLHAPSGILEPLKTAVRNWKAIWDEIRARLPRDMLPEMGFETSADSYWTLTKLVVHRFDVKSSSGSVGAEAYARTGSVGDGNMLADILGDDSAGQMSDAACAAELVGDGGGTLHSGFDFMPLETDCDSQAAHLRKILRRAR